MAAFIFLREGFEVLLVLFALLAVLKRSNRPDAARWVHAGWVCAVLVGALLFLVARGLIDGSNRAWLEAVTSLAAVGMLLYAALWLNRMAGVRENMGHLRSGADRALREGRLSGLFAVSFLAAFREAFETTLFLQALALDAPGATALGALAGVVLLGVAVFFVSRVGFRLPMKQLFSLSTLLLIATALVLLGKGLHELQLLGILASVPFPGPTFGLLGLYPDAVTLGAQLALGLLAFVWVRLVRARG